MGGKILKVSRKYTIGGKLGLFGKKPKKARSVDTASELAAKAALAESTAAEALETKKREQRNRTGKRRFVVDLNLP